MKTAVSWRTLPVPYAGAKLGACFFGAGRSTDGARVPRPPVLGDRTHRHTTRGRLRSGAGIGLLRSYATGTFRGRGCVSPGFPVGVLPAFSMGHCLPHGAWFLPLNRRSSRCFLSGVLTTRSTIYNSLSYWMNCQIKHRGMTLCRIRIRYHPTQGGVPYRTAFFKESFKYRLR